MKIKSLGLHLTGFLLLTCLNFACQVRGQRSEQNNVSDSVQQTKQTTEQTMAGVAGYEVLGHQFELVELMGKDMQQLDPSERPTIEIDLAKLTVNGSTGCNRYMGQVELSGEGAISFKEIASTLRACREGNPERAFVQALYAVRRYSLTDGRSDMLSLLDAEGKLLMRLLRSKDNPQGNSNEQK